MRRYLALLCVLGCGGVNAAQLSAAAVAPAAPGTVALAWTAPTVNANGSTPVGAIASYNVYQGTANGSTCSGLVKVANVPATALAYSTPTLAAGAYCFAITALAPGGSEGPKSNVQFATVAPAPALPTKLVISCPIPKTVGPVVCTASAS